MRMSADTVVFLGPSLPHVDARALLDATYEPPARMGDIYRLLSARVTRFVIIDGVFHGIPSVWHREILDALADGIDVVGASSMGALRAAELHRFGMRGHGAIFEWFRDGILDGDDEVALLHGDADDAFRPLSDPLVNLRATLTALASDGTIAADERDALIAWLKARHYPERSLRALADAPLVSAWPAERQMQFARVCRSHYRDVKCDDAKGVLAWCADNPVVARDDDEGLENDRPERAMWRIGRVLHGTTLSPAGPVTGEALLSKADALAPRLGPILSQRAFLVAWARERGVTCPAEALARARAEWRNNRRPAIASDVEFLSATGLTARRADQLLAERALATWVREHQPGMGDDPTPAIIDDWARSHGIAADADWIIAQGPAHFGLAFHAGAALVEELRLDGTAVALATGG